MYNKNFVRLTDKQLKIVNHTALAAKYNCSQSYVSRVLKSKEEPTAAKAKEIIESARKFADVIEVFLSEKNIKM